MPSSAAAAIACVIEKPKMRPRIWANAPASPDGLAAILFLPSLGNNGKPKMWKKRRSVWGLEMLLGRVRKVQDRYGLTSGAVEYRPELWEGKEQGTLFSLE